MNRVLRRALTVTGAMGGTLVLLTGTASAHFCYRTDVPAKSKMAQGESWHTKAETLAFYGAAEWLPSQECKDAVLAFIDGLPSNTLFMGPGLLAGGAVEQDRGPEGFGHLIDAAPIQAACF